MNNWQWLLHQFSEKLWVRAGFFCLLAMATAFMAYFLQGYIPDGFSHKAGADAVDNILQIIASSMLAVTIFSLSTMVAAFSAASSNVTPRATQLLLHDTTAQNALSVFIGAFLYSLIGIVALSMDVYDESGRLILLVVTIGLIAVIITILLRWINHLSGLGRVGSTIAMVEHATAKSLAHRMEHPYLGGVPLREYKPKRNHYPLCHSKIGYIQNIDVGALEKLATHLDAQFYITMLPGAFNDGASPLFYSTAKLDDELAEAACKTYIISNNRTFEQDPRFGMVVLGEIASRALSAAINDPGTAIDIISTSVRVLAPWASREIIEPEPLHPHIHVPPLRSEDMFDDIFNAIARDATGNVQIAIRLQKAFISLAKMGNEKTREQVRILSRYAWQYAEKTLLLEEDRQTISALAKQVETLTKPA